MLLFHGWVTYSFGSAACTTEQAGLCASMQALPQTLGHPLAPSWAQDLSHPSPTLLRDHLHPQVLRAIPM